MTPHVHTASCTVAGSAAVSDEKGLLVFLSSSFSQRTLWRGMFQCVCLSQWCAFSFCHREDRTYGLFCLPSVRSCCVLPCTALLPCLAVWQMLWQCMLHAQTSVPLQEQTLGVHVQAVCAARSATGVLRPCFPPRVLVWGWPACDTTIATQHIRIGWST